MTLKKINGKATSKSGCKSTWKEVDVSDLVLFIGMVREKATLSSGFSRIKNCFQVLIRADQLQAIYSLTYF